MSEAISRLSPNNSDRAGERRCAPGAVDLFPFRPLVRGIALRLLRPDDADDVVQEVLLQALGADSLPCEAPRLRRFLGTVARNVCIDWLRRRGRSPERQPLDEHDPVDRGADAAALVLRSELDTVLAALPETTRRMLVMHHVENATHREIAALMGLTENAVAARLHRARRRLRCRTRTCLACARPRAIKGSPRSACEVG